MLVINLTFRVFYFASRTIRQNLKYYVNYGIIKFARKNEKSYKRRYDRKLKYNINNNNLYKIFSQLEQELEENKLVINEILKIDYQKSKIKVNSESLKKVIYKLKNENIDLQKDQKIMIIYNGNPTITLKNAQQKY